MLLKLFKLIDGSIVFGDVEGIHTECSTEILIKKPFTAKARGIMPLDMDILANAPAAIQINPMNILWSAPLEDFPQVLEKYEDATSIIEKPKSKIII